MPRIVNVGGQHEGGRTRSVAACAKGYAGEVRRDRLRIWPSTRPLLPGGRSSGSDCCRAGGGRLEACPPSGSGDRDEHPGAARRAATQRRFRFPPTTRLCRAVNVDRSCMRPDIVALGELRRVLKPGAHGLALRRRSGLGSRTQRVSDCSEHREAPRAVQKPLLDELQHRCFAWKAALRREIRVAMASTCLSTGPRRSPAASTRSTSPYFGLALPPRESGPQHD